MGFLDPVAIELKERGRTLTPGSRWGPFETMTVGFGHGIAVTPLHLATGYATLFNGGIYHPATLLKVDREPPGRARPRACSARTPATACARCCGWSSRRAPAGRPTRPAIASAARPAPREKLLNGHYTSSCRGHELRRCVPDGRAALCDGHDARRSQSDRRNLRLPHRGAGTSPRRSAVAVSRIAPMLGVRPDKTREPDMSAVLPFVHETTRRNKHRAPARHCGRRQRFRGHGLCHRPPQGRAGQRVRRVQGRGVQRRGLHSRRRRSRRGRDRRPPRGRGRAACRISPTRAAAPVRRARRQIFRALPGNGGRGDRDQRQDLDRRNDPPDLAHDRPPLGLDRDARSHHLRRPGQDRPDHARHRHLSSNMAGLERMGIDPCRLRGVEPRARPAPLRGRPAGRRGVHQLQPRPSRLSRLDGRLFRSQDAAVRGAPAGRTSRRWCGPTIPNRTK